MNYEEYKNLKGTNFIKDAIEQLSSKYDFEFRYMEKMPRHEALKLMRSADIIIDQLILGHHGFLAVEAMAFGKPVLCYLKPSILKDYPAEIPIVNANPETIYNELEKLIVNSQLRHDIGVRGRAYVEKYHASKILAAEMVSIYNDLIERKKRSKNSR